MRLLQVSHYDSHAAIGNFLRNSHVVQVEIQCNVTFPSSSISAAFIGHYPPLSIPAYAQIYGTISGQSCPHCHSLSADASVRTLNAISMPPTATHLPIFSVHRRTPHWKPLDRRSFISTELLLLLFCQSKSASVYGISGSISNKSAPIASASFLPFLQSLRSPKNTPLIYCPFSPHSFNHALYSLQAAFHQHPAPPDHGNLSRYPMPASAPSHLPSVQNQICQYFL